ncbi:MAG: hypothetical protein HYV65_01235 [Candidatus Spechtbacteria bacterium]|nr:hypothetical protein [Candidatus Spechtbacteria bacterium]
MFPQLQQTITAFDNFIYSYPGIILPIGGFIITIFLIWMIIYMSWFETELLENYIWDFINAWRKTVLPTGKFRKKWERIIKESEVEDEAQWRKALISSDNILDEIIATIGYDGENLDARLLKIQPGNFPYLEDAHKAHQVRVYLEQDLTYRLNRPVFDHVMGIYEKIFQELDIFV